MNLKTLKEELKRDEGLRLKPYRCTQNKLTIGYGRNIEDVGISKHEAEHLLDNDIQRVIFDLDQKLPWFKTLSDSRQRALSNMAFQMGVDKLLKFKKTLSLMEEGKYVSAALEAKNSLWAKQTPERAQRVINLIMED